LITITEITDQDCPAWDAYVKDAAHGLPQHLSGWRQVLRKTHGYETPFLMARDGERVVGVLPIFLVRSFLVGNTAMTMPGGLCAESSEVAAQLIAHGVDIARQARAKRFLLQDTRQAWPGDLHTTTEHVHWIVDVRMDPEELWKGLDGNIRRQVRIARRSELTAEIDRTGRCLGDFYDVFSRCTHQFGTPVFGRDFLEHIIEVFPDGFNIAVVRKDGQPIGGYFQLQMGHTVYGMWGSTLREYFKQRPVYLAYWEMLSDASESGYHFLDMGRSPAGSNASKYKGQWGGASKPIYQQVASIGDSQAATSEANGIHSNGKYQLFMRLWPKLPLPAVQYLGPKLRRHVPFA
jgi:FemAB-related protein (PEP-CTERM system-associated)